MTSFWEILKSSKSLKASDAFAELWGKSIADSWDIITITGSLPLSFLSKGEALTNYRLYGTSEGTGVQTSGTEPAGYKIPLTVTSGEQSGTYPIYIGDTQLMDEEYVDYQEQKVYKRTIQLFDKSKALIGYRVASKGVQQNNSYSCSDYIEIVAGEEYKVSSRPSITNWYFYDNTKTYLSYAEGLTATAPATAKYVRVNISSIDGVDTFMLTVSTEFPETYIPYLQPTDPPAPFPAITAYKGENTLSSTETVGEVSVTGKIKEI